MFNTKSTECIVLLRQGTLKINKYLAGQTVPVAFVNRADAVAVLVYANVAPVAKYELVAILAIWRSAHVADGVVLE